MTNAAVAVIITALFTLGIWLGRNQARSRRHPRAQIRTRIYVSPEELEIL
ncbi:hypothetical protein [Mycobacterium sp. PSTR-4-N]|nr:hypothetical protein [Mycobacterium sp. PSTR-4-N]MCG7596307.1 hypothetical protein [Mycobacterium sp. PSTR-4-N]